MWKYIAQLVLVALTASAQPTIPTAKARTNSMSGVWLIWDHGYTKHYNLTNLTTGQFYLGIPENSALVQGLFGATNQFVVGDTNGSSNILTATNTWQNWTSSITVHTYLVTLPIKTNVWCDIWTSTNLLTWRRIAMIVAPTNSYQFLWTNDFGNRYFRSSATQ